MEVSEDFKEEPTVFNLSNFFTALAKIAVVISLTSLTACMVPLLPAGVGNRELNDSEVEKVKSQLRNELKEQQNLEYDRRRQERSSGGQPGFVETFGVISKPILEGDSSQISLSVEPGLGWEKKKPTLDAKFQAMASLGFASEDQDLIEDLPEKTILIAGCNESDLKSFETELKGRKKVKPSEELSQSFNRILRAESVFICGDSFNPGKLSSLVVARVVYLINAKIRLRGGISQGLNLITEKLYLEGESFVSSESPEQELTLDGGPSIRIAVSKEIQSSGKLKISARGSKYKAATAQHR